ncbi:M64 family metallopeptidase [Actinomadura sp. 21ATH]|uniref:M64 family metallopeptidase n=1 Tax=Actinomadura sp. 21ATH TaxID=1735444 RepID=UPI0035C1DF70
MTTGDGAVVGTTQIVNNGPRTGRWNVVIMGDGYTSHQLTQYRDDAQRTCEAFFDTVPFDQKASFINVFRVDVRSTDSGADDPAGCGGTGATARTYFDATFCSNNLRRLLVVNQNTALAVADDEVPEWHAVLVLVNSTVYGGSGGAVAVSSLATGAQEIALHELGHTAFGLADEYDHLASCEEEGHDDYTGAEPMEPNVTKASTRATIKWRDQILQSTTVPAMRNPDCSKCDRRPSPVPAGTVSAFEGARYFKCGLFRPEYTCKMLELGRPFCAVCRRRILRTLPTTVPSVRERSAAAAGTAVRNAGLNPRFIGSTGSNAWVFSQSPAAGTVVQAGSTVTMRTRTGPIP